jgi:hypothetical protein
LPWSYNLRPALANAYYSSAILIDWIPVIEGINISGPKSQRFNIGAGAIPQKVKNRAGQQTHSLIKLSDNTISHNSQEVMKIERKLFAP